MGTLDLEDAGLAAFVPEPDEAISSCCCHDVARGVICSFEARDAIVHALDDAVWYQICCREMERVGGGDVRQLVRWRVGEGILPGGGGDDAVDVGVWRDARLDAEALREGRHLRGVVQVVRRKGQENFLQPNERGTALA